jgi:GNAT superfamily N-acetyltransferase
MIAIAETDSEIQDCFAVMSELRSHISADAFLPRVKYLSANTGFRLVYLKNGEIKAVGGFRISEWLAGGKYLEIEDLVSKDGDRSKGFGGEIFDWFVNYAKENDCDQIQLVSNIKRLDAHRFYLRKGMSIEAHYFSMSLK